MSEEQAVYETEVSDAMDMLGAGYEIHPPAQVLEMQPDYSLKQGESKAWIKIDVGFRDAMKKLKGSQLSVFLAISLRINEKFESYPSFETISEDTGYSLRAVKSAAKKLHDTGFLTIIKGVKLSNMYHVNAFAAFGKSEPSSAKIAPSAKSDTAECKNEHKNVSEIALKEEPINKNQEEDLNKREKNKKSKLLKGALAFKVSAGEVPTEQDVKDYEEATAGIRWKYRDQFPETLLPLADLCAAYFGDPPKKDLMFWMGEIGDWQQFGCSKEDFESATKAAEKWTQPPASPVSLTKTIRSFRMKRKRIEKGKSNATTQHTQPASQETKDAAARINKRTAERRARAQSVPA